MSDNESPRPLIVVSSSADPGAEPTGEESMVAAGESVERPAKVMRIGSMIKQLLDEVEKAPWTRRVGPG